MYERCEAIVAAMKGDDGMFQAPLPIFSAAGTLWLQLRNNKKRCLITWRWVLESSVEKNLEGYLSSLPHFKARDTKLI